VDILISGVQVLDGDLLAPLAEWTRAPQRARRVLVVTGRQERRVLAALADLPIDGIFDPSREEPETFATALRAVMEGRRYWSPDILEIVGGPRHYIPSKDSPLTATEQLVLAVIGDGCDNAAAAQRLDMKESTIRTIREELHRKLHVQHKGELVRIAAELGFVCFGAHGVIRPGFSQLLAARQWRRARRLSEREAKDSPVSPAATVEE
jgi:DNA-binding NarL/FixJ family response regulator